MLLIRDVYRETEFFHLRSRILDSDPHKRIEVFLNQQIVFKLSGILYPSPNPGSRGEKTTDPGSATLKFYVKVADLTRSGSKTLNSNKNWTWLDQTSIDARFFPTWTLPFAFPVTTPRPATSSKQPMTTKKLFNKNKNFRCKTDEICLKYAKRDRVIFVQS